jgi:hypothetical protein
MKTAKYLYFLMIITLVIIAGVTMYHGFIFAGIFLLILSLASVVNVIDIIQNNSEMQIPQKNTYYSRRENFFNKKLSERQKQKYILQLEKELFELKK